MKKIFNKKFFLQTCFCLYLCISAAACSTSSSSRTYSSLNKLAAEKQSEKINQNQPNRKKITNNQAAKYISAGTKPAETENHGHHQQEYKRMLLFNGKCYIETGETSSIPRCGMMDAQIKSTVSADQIPRKELQSNFGKGYGLQYGSRKNRIDVCIDDKWLIFACNENNLDGVTMVVTKNTSHSAELTITNTTDQNIQFGEEYELEAKDNKTGEWSRVEYLIEDYGFNDPAYLTEKNVPAVWRTDWTAFHGKLKAGTYRIIKEFLDVKENGDYTAYTLMAEFTVKTVR